MIFDGSFFLKRNSVNSLISICLSDLKDQKLPVSTIKTQIDDNRPKIFLPGGLTNGPGSLPVAITARIGQSGRLLMSNLIHVELFQNLTSGFREQDFLRISSCLLLCTYPVILSLYMCVFIFSFPCGYF